MSANADTGSGGWSAAEQECEALRRTARPKESSQYVLFALVSNRADALRQTLRSACGKFGEL